MARPDPTLTQVLTERMRSSNDSDHAALRRALLAAGFDPDQVAVADLHPEGKSIVGHDEFKRMWVTMVTASGAAYLGDLMIDEYHEHFRRLREVPARSIPEFATMSRQLSDNRR